MRKEVDFVRMIILILAVAGLVIGLCSALGGSWLIIMDRQYAQSLPPYPEGPPDAGVYGTLLGWLVLIFGLPLGGFLLLVGALIWLWSRRRRSAGRATLSTG